MEKNKKEKKVTEEEKNIEQEHECCHGDGECCCGGCECENEENELTNLVSELQNKLMYKEAEFVNYRRRKDEETANMLKFANQDLILDIINSMDNFERAINSTKENDENKSLLTGVKMIYNDLVNTLKKYGVEEINTANIPFDHNIHNAIMVEANQDMDDDLVIEILTKGYKLKDRVIRPAMVKVNNK